MRFLPSAILFVAALLYKGTADPSIFAGGDISPERLIYWALLVAGICSCWAAIRSQHER